MKYYFQRTIYILFCILVIFGNYPKFISLKGVSDNINVVEFLFYFVSLLYLCLFGRISKTYIWAFLISLMIFFSTVYGACLHGFSPPSFIQALRLMSMIVSSCVLGNLFFEFFSFNIPLFFNRLIRCYFWNAALGLVALLIFPQSASFWLFLQGFGIVMHGDPHIGRFVSPYFDPNLYAAIAAIPLLCYSAIKSENTVPKPFVFTLLVCLFFTLSRSGLTAFLLLFLILYFARWIPRKIYSIKITAPLYFCAALTVIYALWQWKEGEILFFLHRFARITGDGSALARLDSAKLGWDILQNYPLLGLGYNYLPTWTHFQSAFFSLDSSLFTAMTTLGSLISLCFLAGLLIWSITRWMLTSKYYKEEKILCSAFQSFILYVWLTILFTSQFNNLLFYPFWLIPIISIFTYLSACLRFIHGKVIFSCDRSQ